MQVVVEQIESDLPLNKKQNNNNNNNNNLSQSLWQIWRPDLGGGEYFEKNVGGCASQTSKFCPQVLQPIKNISILNKKHQFC